MNSLWKVDGLGMYARNGAGECLASCAQTGNGAIAPIHPDDEGLSMVVVSQPPGRKVWLDGPAGRWESTYTADVLVAGNSETADLADPARCRLRDREGIWVGTGI